MHALLVTGCLLVGFSSFAAETNAFTPAQVTQIQDIIKQYLVSNPEVLVAASQVLQAKQEVKMEKDSMGAISQNKTALFDDAQSPSIGNVNAPVTVVEFFDYQCGHCRAMAPILEKLVGADNNLRVIFKELPIFGGQSQFAAKVALAASLQANKYYTLHNLLLTSTDSLTKENVLGLARKAGLNMPLLEKDMESPAIDKQLQANFKLAQALKLAGTPTFVIGNKAQTKFRFIPGATSMENLQSEIKAVQ